MDISNIFLFEFRIYEIILILLLFIIIFGCCFKLIEYVNVFKRQTRNIIAHKKEILNHCLKEFKQINDEIEHQEFVNEELNQTYKNIVKNHNEQVEILDNICKLELISQDIVSQTHKNTKVGKKLTSFLLNLVVK
jgi:hypothetical protein